MSKAVLSRIPLHFRLQLNGLLALFGMILVVSAMLFINREHLLEEKAIATRHVVETAVATVTFYADQVKQGKLDQATAQTQALQLLKSMRYGGTEYFWVNDMTPTMIMHPIKPELDGKKLDQSKDSNGTYLFMEFIKTVQQQQAGFVHYLWPKPGSEHPVEKVSFVQGFAPWGWVIGSGIYLDDVNQIFWQQASTLGLAFIPFVLFIAFFSRLIIQTILQSLHHASQFAGAIAQGNLTEPLIHTQKDEIGYLLLRLDEMRNGLERVVREVRQSSQEVSVAAGEIAMGNSDFSDRTQAQASAVEQTVSSMEQMTASVRQNAESARLANQLSTQAREDATQGAKVIANAIEAMKAIHHSSQQIAAITSVIDEIAFQTNLLALNAAVEAARSGEHGRGFAVVASEVRALAQRSAAAAREIKGLITESVHKVETGANLIDQSNAVLHTIVTSVKRVTDTMSEIALASSEQLKGIEQVNQAVAQMDQGIQQNAALTEEAAASSKSLEQSAYQLVQLVDFFQVRQ